MSIDQMLMYILILTAQCVSSLLSTATVHAVTGNSIKKAILIAAISDTLKLSLTSGIIISVIGGNTMAIAAAVTGGVVGNYIAMVIKSK